MTTKGIDRLYNVMSSPDAAYCKASRDIHDLRRLKRLTDEEARALAEYNQQKHREAYAASAEA